MREIGRNLADLTTRSSTVDQIVFLELDNYSDDPTDLTKAYAVQPRITDGDLAVSSTNIEDPTKKGTSSRSKSVRGPEDIAGGMTLSVKGGTSQALILAALTQMPEVAWNLLNGTGQTFPAEVEVVDNTGDLTSVAPRTPDDDLSSTTNPVRIQVEPVRSIVNVIAGENLSPAGSKTVADDLGSGGTDLSGNIPLTITPTGATLTAPTTPGTIVVVYDDADGNSQTLTYSFASDVLTVAQTMTLVNVDDITSVTTAGFSAGTFDATAYDPNEVQLADGVTRAAIEVWGTDEDDEVIWNEIVYTSTDKANTKVSTEFFKTVTAVYAAEASSHTTGIRVAGWSAGKYKITAQDTAVHAVFRPRDDRIRRFLKVEYSKGGDPNVYGGLVLNSYSFSIGRGNSIQSTMGFLGKRARIRENLAGNKVTYSPTGTTYPTQTDISSLKLDTGPTYSGWEGYFEVDGLRQGMETVDISVEQNFKNSDATTGYRWQEMQPVRDGLRNVTLSVTMKVTRENQLYRLFAEAKTLKDCKLILRYKIKGGAIIEEIWNFPQIEITTAPDPATSGQTEITVGVTMMAFDESLGQPTDYNVELKLPEFTAPRAYAI